MAEVDLIKKATRQYDKQREEEKQKTMFDRIMAYTSQNYNKDTNKFLPPINAYVGDDNASNHAHGHDHELLCNSSCSQRREGIVNRRHLPNCETGYFLKSILLNTEVTIDMALKCDDVGWRQM